MSKLAQYRAKAGDLADTSTVTLAGLAVDETAQLEVGFWREVRRASIAR